jgi:hypothetical protein
MYPVKRTEYRVINQNVSARNSTLKSTMVAPPDGTNVV